MSTKVTISQVADLAEVSIATVSRFINNSASVKKQTAQRIMDAIKTLDYPLPSDFYLLNHPQSDRGHMITISLPSISNPFYSDVLKGAQAAAKRHNYYTNVNVQHLDPSTLSDFMEFMEYSGSQGAIIMNAMNRELFDLLYKRMPFVQCCEFTENQELVSYTSIDDMQAAKKMTEYLISTGRTKIGFLSGPMRYKYARHRMAGYKAALEEAGIPLHPEWILTLPELDFKMAVSSVQQLMTQKGHPDALFTVSDLLAAAAIQASRTAGLIVPDDIFVSGFDNVDISQAVFPAITTINLPKYQLGYMACELLIERLENPDVKVKQILLNAELIIRESTQK